MPWNPMRAEQRIGRIDRLGQLRPVVTVKNYFVPGTVEESVYAALRIRIDDFADLLGNLQPILGATEEAFRRIFRAPRSERKSAEEAAIRSLDETIKSVKEAGVDLEVEDPIPVPTYDPAPVQLSDLRDMVGEALASGGRPVTFERVRVSRDPTTWVALGTYGHPRLPELLDHIAASEDGVGDAALVIAEDEAGAAASYRADRTPPEPVHSIAELDELGAPGSIGDAAEAAEAAAARATAARRGRVARVLAAREEGWEESLRRRLAELVGEAVRSEVATARRRGDEIGPLLAWQELRRDELHGFGFVEEFASRIELDLSRVVPRDVDSPKATLTRQQAGERLYALIGEWNARAPSA
jgi:hypothetical protein